MPPTSKLFLSGCRHRPSEKTAIHVRYVHPFSVATLKWGLEGATNVRSLSGVMAVFFEEPGMVMQQTTLTQVPRQNNKATFAIRKIHNPESS